MECTAAYTRNYFKLKKLATKEKNGKVKTPERRKVEQETMYMIKQHLTDAISQYCLVDGFKPYCPDSDDYIKEESLYFESYQNWLKKYKKNEKVVAEREGLNKIHKEIFDDEGEDGYPR